MATSKPSKKPATSAPGVKMLIAAASLAATVGGWAVISAKEPKPTAALAPTQAVAPAVTIKLAPLPTLVPAITPQPQPGTQLVTIGQPRSAVAAPAPQPAPATELVLRDVSAPQVNAGGGSAAAPAPVANTGSSR